MISVSIFRDKDIIKTLVWALLIWASKQSLSNVLKTTHNTAQQCPGIHPQQPSIEAVAFFHGKILLKCYVVASYSLHCENDEQDIECLTFIMFLFLFKEML